MNLVADDQKVYQTASQLINTSTIYRLMIYNHRPRHKACTCHICLTEVVASVSQLTRHAAADGIAGHGIRVTASPQLMATCLMPQRLMGF